MHTILYLGRDPASSAVRIPGLSILLPPAAFGTR